MAHLLNGPIIVLLYSARFMLYLVFLNQSVLSQELSYLCLCHWQVELCLIRLEAVVVVSTQKLARMRLQQMPSR
jgi:hypothetical protein